MNMLKNLIVLSLCAASITTTTHAIPLRLDKDTYTAKKKNIRKKAATCSPLALSISLCYNNKVNKDQVAYFLKHRNDFLGYPFSKQTISRLKEEAQDALKEQNEKKYQESIKMAEDKAGIRQSIIIVSVSALAFASSIALALCPQPIAYPLSLVRS